MRMLLLALAILLAPASAAALSLGQGELAFVAVDRGVPQIFAISADGAGRRQLTSASGPSTTPVWSSDGQRIAFVRQTGDDTQIYVMNTDGTSKRSLTSGRGRRASPGWSPDGQQIVFTETRNGVSQIATMRSDGTQRRVLAPSLRDQRAPAWSPDGQLIAFLFRASLGHLDLYVIAADGQRLRQVPTPAFGLQPDVTGFTWLPDGRLAYSNRSGTAQETVTVTTVDGAKHELLGTASSPAWAPDGQRLAFVLSRVGGAQIDVRDNADAKPVRLTDPRLICVRPVWSPDGRQIAFLIIEGGTVTLTVMDADGGHQRRLAEIYGDLSARPVFSWRPR